jgi:hypothetical protein
MRNYIAVNQYRGASSNGFANTWLIFEVATRARRNEILRDGLEVNDQCYIDTHGGRTPCKSTMGVRAATRAEIRSYNNDVRQNPETYRNFLE